MHLISIVPGFKWNVSDTWVLGANVTVPVTATGLTAPFTPSVGLDYAIGTLASAPRGRTGSATPVRSCEA